jgi:hypothetical protein
MEFKVIISKEADRAKTNDELNQYINNNPLLQNLFAMPMLDNELKNKNSKLEDYDFKEGDKSD